MPLRRRILLATKSPAKVDELAQSLTKYDVEIRMAPLTVLESEASIRHALSEFGDDYWVKAIFREEMHLYPMPDGGMSKFECDWDRTEADRIVVSDAPEHDCRPVVAFSHLIVYQLPMSEQKLVREAQIYGQAMSLHTHPAATGSKEEGSEEHSSLGGYPQIAAREPAGPLEKKVYEHAIGGYIDFSRRDPRKPAEFGWDDVFVLRNLNMTFSEIRALGCQKVSPRDITVNAWIIEKLHYSDRRSTKFICKTKSGASILAPFVSTISFSEEHSVGTFVSKSEHMNNSVARETGVLDVFVAVANHGAFFRAAHTRREVNYWLPGLNAGIPFVPKRDPIHEVTFTAHDFGHFLIPDLMYTGGVSRNCRRTYILYRMMSEGTTLVFADMLFVETLHRSGYEYDWSKRKIHPLFQATGVNPFDTKSRETFCQCFKKLLAANVEYCLTGKSDKYLELIRANNALDTKPDSTGAFTECSALDNFKETYMPFFVEDYRWTSTNYSNMEKNASQRRAWWSLVEPLISAMGLTGITQSGIGLESVEQFMKAIELGNEDLLSTTDLIDRIFDRVFSTRIQPIFEGREALELTSPAARRTQAFVRYMVGQCCIFARFPFLKESEEYGQKIITFLSTKIRRDGMEAISESDVASVRGLYNMYLRILVEKGLLTTDDAYNFAEICPLFEPFYVSYDQDASFYQQLDDIQRQILEDV